jgi:hypothetical protein
VNSVRRTAKIPWVRARRYIAAAVAVLCLGGCTDHSEDRAIEQVLKDARAALLAGNGARACRLLTAHGREQASAFGAGSCEEIVRDQRRRAERDPDSHLEQDLREADLEVLSVTDGRAQTELRVQDQFGTAIRWRIQLRKTGAGWRIDDSNAVPTAG